MTGRNMSMSTTPLTASGSLNLKRNSRILEVKAGGHTFRGELKEDGAHTWEETLAK